MSFYDYSLLCHCHYGFPLGSLVAVWNKYTCTLLWFIAALFLTCEGKCRLTCCCFIWLFQVLDTFLWRVCVCYFCHSFKLCPQSYTCMSVTVKFTKLLYRCIYSPTDTFDVQLECNIVCFWLSMSFPWRGRYQLIFCRSQSTSSVFVHAHCGKIHGSQICVTDLKFYVILPVWNILCVTVDV